MKRTTYVTPEEFTKLKLSEAILYVIEDVKRITAMGYKIYMHSWVANNMDGDMYGEENKLCSVCLGGAAVLGFQPDKVINNGYDNIRKIVVEDCDLNIQKTRNTFDNLRFGDISCALYTWNGIFPKENINEDMLQRDFQNHLDKKEVNRLIAYLQRISKYLSKIGY